MDPWSKPASEPSPDERPFDHRSPEGSSAPTPPDPEVPPDPDVPPVPETPPAQWPTPAPELPPVEMEPPPLPTARELIAVGLELALRSSRSIRNASLAIGLQLLAAAGPLVLLIIVVATRAPSALDMAATGATPVPGSPEETISAAFSVTFLVGALALTLLTIESRIVAVALLGGQAARRSMEPHEGLRRSRQVFWRVVAATLIVQVPLFFISDLVQSVAAAVLGGSVEAVLVVGVVATTLMTVPFAYLLTGIVLGDATPGMAIRRSIDLARTRWRLALVAAVAEALAETLLILGLGAGLDVVATVAGGLGLGLESGTASTFLTLALALLGTAAVGSLIFTVAALAAAPQVVAFVGLTRYTAGLDPARDAAGGRSVRWVSIPMSIGIVIALVASLAGVSAAVRAG
jgi:hypothetical protein